ncbi:MAG: CHAT domain-containing protein [Blastocatellia bacterium]|nr:CHAT domain-containing protein [Blastocatellia bacterium]
MHRRKMTRRHASLRRPRLALLLTLLLAMVPPAGTHPAPAAAAQATPVVEEGTLLLEYLLGEKNSSLWAITADAAELFELPGRAEIDQAAQRVYDLLTARTPRENETNLMALRRADQARGQYPAAAMELSQMILGPVADRLGKRRLLIVADGSLHSIPFAALPAPIARRAQSVNEQTSTRTLKRERNAGQPIAGYRQLIADHEVASLPSASVLGMLRQRRQTRAIAPKLLAMLADPVFEKDDPRFRQTAPTPLPGGESMTRSGAAKVRVAGLGGPLARLRFARAEADQILATLTPAQRKQSLAAFDFAANQDLALSPEIGQYRYLHFATHGVLDARQPELSGLALSSFEPDGRERDGFLRLVEIYNLRLAADLVTLSACETGLGKQIRGEGIVGLTRGFLHAGADRVLVSLWKVDDRASARLMARVYDGIFREQLTPAAALRKAQLSMRDDPAFNDPFFWAAFVLHGEPR